MQLGPRELRTAGAGRGAESSCPGYHGGGGGRHVWENERWLCSFIEQKRTSVLLRARQASDPEDAKGKDIGLVVKEGTAEGSVGEAHRRTITVPGHSKA